MTRQIEEIEKIYDDLGIKYNYGNTRPPINDLKTNFPTRFKNINITANSVLTK